MPTFTNTCMKNESTRPAATSRPKDSWDCPAIQSPRKTTIPTSTRITRTPSSPNSSANTANTKSVERSGRKSSCDCVPLSHPFP